MSAILRAIDSDYCTRCGLPVGPYLLRSQGCRMCRGQRLPYETLVRVGRYDGPIGELVRMYKYQSRERLDRPLGRLVASSIEGHLPAASIDVIVPVPATRASLLKYRFSPVRQLAQVIARKLDIPLLDALRIKGKKQRQTELPFSQRLTNVRGVFHLKPGIDISDAVICMVDDVCTSGATFREVARTLKKAGARQVFAACIAKAAPSAWQATHTEPAHEYTHTPRAAHHPVA